MLHKYSPAANANGNGLVNLSALNGTVGGGGGGGTSSAPPPRPTIIQPCTITFVGLYIGEITQLSNSGTTARKIIPLNIEDVCNVPPSRVNTYDNDMVNLYERATAKGDAIMFQVKGITGKPVGASKKKPVNYHKIDPVHDAPHATVANNGVLTVGEFIKGNNAQQHLLPWTFVTVYNLSMRSWTDDKGGKERLSFNVSRLDAVPWAAINAFPLERRAEIAFPRCKQMMPDVRDWLPLAKIFNAAFVPGNGVIDAGADKAKERKQTQAFVRDLLGNLQPVSLFAANRAYEFGIFHADDEKEPETIGSDNPTPLRFVVPPLGLVPVPGVVADTTDHDFETVLVNVGESVHRTTTEQSITNHKISMEPDFVCIMYQGIKQVHRQYYANCRIYVSMFESLGIYYPEWIGRAFALHPIPFLAITGVNVAATVNDPTNFTLDTTPTESFKQGHIVGNVELAHFEIARYLRDHGIPCTRQFVATRYGPESDAGVSKETKETRTSAFKDDAIDPEKPAVLLARDGFVAFDTSQSRKVLPETFPNVKYYALNLIQLNDPLPRAPRDPGQTAPLSPEYLSEVVSMTPEQGDAFILKTFGKKPPQKSDDWFQKKGPGIPAGMPTFLFFAVADTSARLEINPVVEAQIKTIFKPANKLETAEAAKLPANINALRRQLIQRLVDPSSSSSSSVPPTEKVLKNDPMDVQLEDDGEEEEEPETLKRKSDGEEKEQSATKRARLDPVAARRQQDNSVNSLEDVDEEEWA